VGCGSDCFSWSVCCSGKWEWLSGLHWVREWTGMGGMHVEEGCCGLPGVWLVACLGDRVLREGRSGGAVWELWLLVQLGVGS